MRVVFYVLTSFLAVLPVAAVLASPAGKLLP